MRVSFDLLTRILLPFHKRQPVRMLILSVFSGKGNHLMVELSKLAGDAIKSLNVNGQTMVLQSHLSRLFNANISISHYEQNTLTVGLEVGDGALSYIAVGLYTEPDPSEGDLPPDPGGGGHPFPPGEPGDGFDEPTEPEEPVYSEDDDYVLVSLLGESLSELSFDYQVNVPQGVNQSLLISELDKYRLAGKTYNIITV